MSCTCDISLSYAFLEGELQTQYNYNDLIISNSTRNGKSQYFWNDGVFDRVIYWNGTDKWLFATIVEGIEYLVPYSLTEDIDCPDGIWLLDQHDTQSYNWLYFNVFSDCITPIEREEIAEKIKCFKLKVWQLQCSFAEKVGTYFNNLSYGIPCTRSLNDLMIMKYGLEVLNNYNPDDIHNNTTDYNTITYSEIQNIITQLNT